jgi:transcriptional regulator with XRE-family HTH domain
VQKDEVDMSLARIRKQRGLTIEHVAVLAGVHKSTISRAERGLQTLRPETVVKLSKALKVSPSRIIERA